MRRFLNLFFIVFINMFFGISQVHAAPITKDKVKEIVTQVMKEDHIAGAAVAVIFHGKKTIYVFGKTDGDEIMPITDNTLFELGSVTKLMTTLLLSEEIQDRQVHLADSMTDYLSQYSKNFYIKKITLEQLATHTSGLPFNEPASFRTQSQLTHYLLHWKPTAHSATTWQYSNLGMGLLGDALAARDHKSINHLFETDIFMPLNMTRSNLLTRSDTQHLLGFFPAAWAVNSDIKDMSDFLAAAIGLPYIPRNIIFAMHYAQIPRVKVGTMDQALAWEIYPLTNKQKLLHISRYQDLLRISHITKLPSNEQYYNPNTLMEKTGATNGFRAYIGVIPNQKSGVVILFNKCISEKDLVTTGRKILF